MHPSLAAPRGVFGIVLLAALVAFAGQAEAKGKRGGSSSSSKSTSAKAHKDEDAASGNGSSGTHLTIRRGTSSSSSNSNSGGALGNHLVPLEDREPTQVEKEDAEKRATQMAAYEREQAQKAAERKAAAEKAEAERLAAEKAAEERAAQKAAEEKALDAKAAAAEAQKKREQAAVAADVDRVLQRAKADHPILATPEGASMLHSILERQKVLAAKGMYPSIAMVEAVADHREALAPRPKREPQTMPVSATAANQEQAAKAYGGCRWVTPYQWSCK